MFRKETDSSPQLASGYCIRHRDFFSVVPDKIVNCSDLIFRKFNF